MNPADSIKEFYTMMAMVGLKEQGGVFALTLGSKPEEIRARTEVDDVTIEALGGKRQALKLLRHVEVAKMACSIDRDIFPIIAGPFERVVEAFPILRGYYEMAKIGAAPHTWRTNYTSRNR